MNRTFTSMFAVLSLTTSAGLLASPRMAQAVPFIDDQRGVAPLIPFDEIAYRYHGRSYCWYFDGWQGAGWYRCGFARRRGLGWGGGDGWRSWSAPMNRGRGPDRERRPSFNDGDRPSFGGNGSQQEPRGERRGSGRDAAPTSNAPPAMQPRLDTHPQAPLGAGAPDAGRRGGERPNRGGEGGMRGGAEPR